MMVLLVWLRLLSIGCVCCRWLVCVVVVCSCLFVFGFCVCCDRFVFTFVVVFSLVVVG